MYSSVAFVCLLMPHIITSNPTYLPPGFPFHNVPAPQPLPPFQPGFPFHNVQAPQPLPPFQPDFPFHNVPAPQPFPPVFPFYNYDPFAYYPYIFLPGQSSTTPKEQENNGTMEEKAEGRKADPFRCRYVNGQLSKLGCTSLWGV